MKPNYTKIKVLVADDSPNSRKWAMASLIKNPHHNFMESQVLELVQEAFDIAQAKNPNEVLAIIKDGFRPDLAILDLNFDDYMPGSNEQNKIDRNIMTKGFELARYIKERFGSDTLIIIFTAHYGEEEVVKEAKKYKLIVGKDIILKHSKGHGGTLLAIDMPDFLFEVAKNRFSLISSFQITEIKKAMRLAKDSIILEKVVLIEGMQYKLKSLLMRDAFIYQRSGSDLCEIAYEHPKETVEDLINHRDTLHRDFVPNGSFKKDDIAEALLDFESASDYEHANEQLSLRAANFLLEVYRKSSISKMKLVDFSPLIHEPGDFARGRRSFAKPIHDDPEFYYLFINTLILRRFFIGLYVLYKEKSIYPEDWKKEILFYGVEIIDPGVGEQRKKEIITTELGLHPKYRTPQKLLIEFPYITRDEERWLKRFIPIITEYSSKSNDLYIV